MKFAQILLLIVLSAATAFTTATYIDSKHAGSVGQAPVRESAYDRVMETGILRCGYIVYPKILERDPNTGKFSGIYYDFVEELGRQLSLKIDWTEEVGFSTAFDGLKAGRYDAMCFPFTQTPSKARVTEFTIPIFYMPFFLYARADDTRFDNNYDKINDPSVRMAFLEGELSQVIRNEVFPQSQPVSLPNLSDPSQVYLAVASNKADLAMAEPSSTEAFLANNPGKLKRVAGPSIRMQNLGMDVAVGEEQLKSLLNTTIQSMYLTGYTDRLLNKYTTGPDQFYYAAPPWGDSSKPPVNQNP